MKATVRGMAIAALTVTALAIFTAAAAASEFDKYGLKSASTSLSSTQAGEHADLTVAFELTKQESGEHARRPYAYTRDVEVKLPPGIVGNPQAKGLSSCSVGQLGNLPAESECPRASQVGVTEISVTEENFAATLLEPVYNMASPGGDIVARIGFFASGYPALINVQIDPVDYSLVATMKGAPAAAGLVAASFTLWGVPSASSHDDERMTPLEARGQQSPPPRSVEPAAPFMTNPTDCTMSRQVTVTARSYQLPDNPSTITAPLEDITGCGKISFNPSFTAVPTDPEAAAPTGLDAELVIPQDETPVGRGTSTLKGAVVTLPAGLAINPSAGDGLGACSPEQVGYGKSEPSHCPDSAKIGSVEIEAPALADTLHGSVYQRTPEPGHLFGFWLVTDEQGVHLKLPAEIEADPLTGQLTTVFAGIPALGGNPQFPISDLKLDVFGGPRAPLATPASCGTYQTHYSFTPWSGKPPSEGDTPMQITSDCNKGGFAPGLSAGTRSLEAGSFSPFVFTLTRADGEANPQEISLTLPEGLLAKLGGVPLCPEAAVSTGGCPAASRVGSVAAAVGVGSEPLWIPQPGRSPTAVYLAGPYKGAPYSVVSVVPAQAGPFDLGTVVNRAGIFINPSTAQATIKTDPLPQILQGVPVSYRTIQVEVDRPDFTLNPTGCTRRETETEITASNGATAHPSDAFKAINCDKLAYSPRLRLIFAGSSKRTGNPAVKAVLTQKRRQANTKAAVVLLPASEFIDNSHISTPCTRVQFDAEKCPKGSILGHAKAFTPLLDQPLQGPVYFRSNGGERELPDLVADLHGPIHVVLVGFIDSVKTGRESSRVRTRFLNVPDAPVTRFTMSLYGGKRGLIENSVNLCKHPRTAESILKAQNGAVRTTSQRIEMRCGKGRRANRR
jgi:hypothetical protein